MKGQLLPFSYGARVIAGFALAAAFGSPGGGFAQTRTATSQLCRVKHVSDGDSFVCTDGRRVRLLLIDAPELRQGSLGSKSRSHLGRLLPAGTLVHLSFDVQQRDRHGRYLAFVRRGEVDINREMLRSGMAVVLVYPPNVKHVELMRVTADSARRENRGLWALNGFNCLPVQYRARRCE